MRNPKLAHILVPFVGRDLIDFVFIFMNCICQVQPL